MSDTVCLELSLDLNLNDLKYVCVFFSDSLLYMV